MLEFNDAPRRFFLDDCPIVKVLAQDFDSLSHLYEVTFHERGFRVKEFNKVNWFPPYMG